jgi:hypothetical protein
MLTVGATSAVTVMVSQSDKLGVVQLFASVTLVMQYEVVPAGVTETLEAAVVNTNGQETPAPDPFTLHGPVPLRRSDRLALAPEQMVVEPFNDACGRLFTVTVIALLWALAHVGLSV